MDSRDVPRIAVCVSRDIPRIEDSRDDQFASLEVVPRIFVSRDYNFLGTSLEFNISIYMLRCSLLVTCYVLLVTRYLFLVTRYLLIITCFSLLVTGYSLLVTRYLLLVTCYSLLVTNNNNNSGTINKVRSILKQLTMY